VADHPLRSANHHRLGEPLPHQLANSTQAYPSAVARGHLSPRKDLCSINLDFSRVSFTKGEILTRYSPVCHSTRFRRNFLVRLACVKHAASVHSEPGSNSPYQNSLKSKCPSQSRQIFICCALIQSHQIRDWICPIFSRLDGYIRCVNSGCNVLCISKNFSPSILLAHFSRQRMYYDIVFKLKCKDF
jgi:hypothetical protein